MTLRDIERDSIRAFVQSAADDGYLSGCVLDYGCGKQPYRDIVEAAGGDYHGWDHPANPGYTGGDIGGVDQPLLLRWDAILCTQVLQYVPDDWEAVRSAWIGVRGMIGDMEVVLNEGGHLVLTYPTNWPEVEPEDLHRFTKAGMERLLTEAGFEIIRHDFRHGIQYEGVSFVAGYGVIARA